MSPGFTSRWISPDSCKYLSAFGCSGVAKLRCFRVCALGFLGLESSVWGFRDYIGD